MIACDACFLSLALVNSLKRNEEELHSLVTEKAFPVSSHAILAVKRTKSPVFL